MSKNRTVLTLMIAMAAASGVTFAQAAGGGGAAGARREQVQPAVLLRRALRVRVARA